jgi:cysteine desulfurase
MRRIDLDHASTTRPAPEVREAMLPYLDERCANASSLHRRGREARQAVEEARTSVASLVGAVPEEIVFTASASEANNLALKGIALASPVGRGRILAAATEHLSVLHPLRTLERRGFPVGLLPVDRHGLVDPDDLRRTLTDDTILVSVAHASAEIGSLQPLEAICRAAHARGVPVHCDAALTAGIVAMPEGEDRPDLLTLSSHLFYGPQGVGALRVREGCRLAPLVEGGPQELGLRAGTEPLAAIVGFGAAARLARRDKTPRAERAARLAARLRDQLLDRLEGWIPTGDPVRRVPGHLSLCLSGVEAEALLGALDDEGIEAASGSACTTEIGKPSHVLQAIGIDPVLARGALVLSFGYDNEDGDAETVAARLPEAVRRLRALSPLPATRPDSRPDP